MSGRILLSQTATGETEILKVGNLTKGIYFVRINELTEKLIIKH
jgi:hypothetical protein